MTEKRFTITQDFEEHHRQIRDNGHIIMGCFVEPQAEVIVDLLNELDEKYVDEFSLRETLQQELQRVENENEQLKQQLSSINQLIDNKIDEFKNGDYGDLPCNTIHMFLDLKQELGDVE